MRSYVGLSVAMSFCLLFAAACSSSDGDQGNGGNGGDGGTGGGMGGVGGDGGMGGTGGVDGIEKIKVISLGCANSSPIGFQSILSAELSVTAPDPVAASSEFSASVGGTATFPESFLDAAQAVIMGGLQQAELEELQYIAQVRSGATGDDVMLAADVDALTPGLVVGCAIVPEDGPCDPANDVDPEDPNMGNTDCQPVFEGNGCLSRILVDVPTSDDCAPDGVCDMLGKAGPESQCDINEFCVTGDLDVPLLATTQSYTADATGPVLFGWADTGLSNNTYDETEMLYTLPKPIATLPVEQGLKVNAGLVVSIECVMGVDGGEDPMNAENTLVGLTPDGELIDFAVQ